MKSRRVCIKTRSPPASLPLKGQVTRHTTVKWPIAIHCDGHILISFVFPQFTSFHSVFHSFHGLKNSINWPVSSLWVFIAQLVEHCSVNAEATDSNPVEAPKTFFRATLQLFNLRFNCDGHIFILLLSVMVLTRVETQGKQGFTVHEDSMTKRAVAFSLSCEGTCKGTCIERTSCN